MTLHAGARVWMPCEVKAGPFSDERMVRITIEGVEWLGFAPLSALKDKIAEGRTFIQTLVLDVSGDNFLAQPQAFGVTATPFRGSISKSQALALGSL